MKPQHLYHGSPREIVKGVLFPRQPIDLGGNKANLQHAVYASPIKEFALIMAFLHCKGVNASGFDFNKGELGVIYDGWPKQEHVYLYALPPKTFRKTDPSGFQWRSIEPVKALGIEKISVSDYLNLVRKATKEETDHWFERYRGTITSIKKE